MSAIILDGRPVADAIIRRAAQKLQGCGNPKAVLATVLVGASVPSRLYVNLKRKKAAQAGLKSELIELPEDAAQHEIEKQLAELSADDKVAGILLQLPLPEGIDTKSALDRITPEKDVDGLTRENLGNLLRGDPGLVPCTPLGVMRMIEHYEIPTQGKQAVVVGRSYLAGLPQVLLLAKKGVDATVTLCHSKTETLDAVCRQADILVSAVGVPGLIGADYVKPGAAVFDVGVSDTEDGIKGDVEFDAAREIAGWLTPMPGGTGPVTVACLIENAVNQITSFHG